MLLCIDIGNTHTHYGMVAGDQTRFLDHLPTGLIDHPADGLAGKLANMSASQAGIEAIAFCSVVPKATERLLAFLEGAAPKKSVFQLTHEKKIGIPIGYPRPAEIGQDRLANAAAAFALAGAPAIVIDMGTAVTFDIVTRAHGFTGGIIAPGVEVMRRYLHEQTALLPRLDDSIEITRAIGQSTVEAMRIGTVVGFGGMINALLEAVLEQLSAQGEPSPRILTTGGSADLLKKSLHGRGEHVPDLTLRGLAAAWKLNQ
jgi:type III pantothenate kinase